MICGSRGSKSSLSKAAGAEPSGSAKHISKSKCTKHLSFGALLEIAMSKKCTPLWREARFQVKRYKAHHSRTTFGSWDVCKSARRCGAKHISKSKCTKHTNVGALIEVQTFKKCTPLWREAHSQVKSVKKLTVSDHLWTFRWRPAWQAQGIVNLAKSEQKHEGFVAISTTNTYTIHYTTLHYTTLHHTTLQYSTLQLQLQLQMQMQMQLQYNYTTLHHTSYSTLRYNTFHYTTLHFTTLHSITVNHTALH